MDEEIKNVQNEDGINEVSQQQRLTVLRECTEHLPAVLPKCSVQRKIRQRALRLI